jgi:DNA-binding PadR family transcriptional regulator
MDLSPTAYVILGMLRDQPRCGYEIKSAVDNSTRFFWAASYGQIYPELRKLSEAGLIEGRPDARGDRKRVEFKLTAAGRKELLSWLRRPPETFELRDEGLLKLFFSGAAEPEDAAATLRAMREHHRALVERLRDIEPKAAASGGGYPLLVLKGGIEYNEWLADWCERMERDVLAKPAKERMSV